MAKKKASAKAIREKTYKLKNKVETNRFDYEEEVKEFTGLIFHCPNCDEVFHLHIATVRLKKDEM